MNPHEAKINFGWPGHDVLRVYNSGTVEVDGEETENPWVIGKAFLRFATEFAEIHQRQQSFE
jgi:hypothetical protein